MENNITININVEPEGLTVKENKPKIKNTKTKLGKKSVLELPMHEPNMTTNSPILDLMGI